VSIDTRQKRSSVLEVPVIQYLPVADGTIDAKDRMLVAGLYGGLEPRFDDFFFWRKTQDGQAPWQNAAAAGQVINSPTRPTDMGWVKVAEVRDGV
jgi:hypothetical protein